MMWENGSDPDLEGTAAERVVAALLDDWTAGIAERRPTDVASLFTENALFQGFDPEPGVGREYIADYYAKQPVGLTADYELVSVRELATGAVLAYARVHFARPEGDVTVYLTTVAQRRRAEWALSHYHVSKQTRRGAESEETSS